MLLNSARSLAADLANHSTSDRAPHGWISLFLVLSQIRFERFFMNESINILFISCYLEGVWKEEGGGGVLLIIYSVNFNPATYLMLQILQETFN